MKIALFDGKSYKRRDKERESVFIALNYLCNTYKRTPTHSERSAYDKYDIITNTKFIQV